MDVLVQKLEEGQALAQASMARRQQIMEENVNCSRQQSEVFKVGDSVWLNLKNIATPRPSKKLAWLHAKYKVTKIISHHVVELDIPIGIHPRFHVDMLKRAENDPLPSQKQDDYFPAPVNVNMPRIYQEWEIERIIKAGRKRRGRGIQRLVLVKWKGQKEPTWEPRSQLEDTAAMDIFEKKYGIGDNVGEESVEMFTGVKFNLLDEANRIQSNIQNPEAVLVAHSNKSLYKNITKNRTN